MSSARDELAAIHTFPQLVRYLRDELDWPVSSDDFEDLVFDYAAEDLGIDAHNAAKIQEIKRLRPLSARQPWGIFFVKFEPKRLPVVALRRILSGVALKKRASANSPDHAAWSVSDLLFISNYGEGDERQISFAHFSQDPTKQDLPALKVLGWDNLDTPLHLDAVAEKLAHNLTWPEDEEDSASWRAQWEAAFSLRHREVITTSREMALRLAELARSIRDRITTALAIETSRGPLTQLMKAFQVSLVHDLDARGFADMYAQTIAYGLLSARIEDPHGKTSEHLAGHMRTNPFLRDLMQTFLHVGGRRGSSGGPGIDFDELGVNDVVQLLDDSNMEAVIRDFGDRNPEEDPVIHFYELFLKEYDERQRMQRGVFYTPRPVVSYIVSTVDRLLRTELGLRDGLADTSTWGDMVGRIPGLQVPEDTRPDQPFVQILDPATGTGTFLVEIIGAIHRTMVARWLSEGLSDREIMSAWNTYVPLHLLPRLHGFELLMAPYAIAHLKIGLKLHETGYRFGSDQRAQVFLANSLEPARDFTDRLEFAVPALAREAVAVNAVKKHTRFTVVVGNPPYSQYSMNLTDDAKAHIEKFRYSDGQRIRARNALQLERNLNDDYVKFLGMATGLIPGAGVLGMITNRMFLDSESLVGLREWLVTNFGVVRVLDLWGSSEEARRVERLSGDENVFDILQGVAISFAIRQPGATRSVAARELIGSRVTKYRALLDDLSLDDAEWGATSPATPDWWLHRTPEHDTETLAGMPVDHIFPRFSTLVASNRDHLVVSIDRARVVENVTAVRDFKGSNAEWAERFGLTLKTGWNVTAARAKLRAISDVSDEVRPIEYRPMDRRWIFFHPTLVWQTAPIVSSSVLADDRNLVLLSLGRNRASTTNGFWVTRNLADKSVISTRDNASGFPLYLPPDSDSLSLLPDVRVPNLAPAFRRAIQESLGLSVWGAEPGRPSDAIAPERVFAYIYGLLYSASYRARYSRKLVTGFPVIPLPADPSLFTELGELGDRLVSVHLLENSSKSSPPPIYVGPAAPVVTRPTWARDSVWLEGEPTKDASGRFEGIPSSVWEFQIGTHQVCEKWLKDRKGRPLSADDISHYKAIVLAVTDTIHIMSEIDEVIDRHGGWPGAFAARTGDEPQGIPH